VDFAEARDSYVQGILEEFRKKRGNRLAIALGGSKSGTSEVGRRGA
jgi:hypothetical protein